MDKVEEGLRLLKLGFEELNAAKNDAERQQMITGARLNLIEMRMGIDSHSEYLQSRRTSAMHPANTSYTHDSMPTPPESAVRAKPGPLYASGRFYAANRYPNVDSSGSSVSSTSSPAQIPAVQSPSKHNPRPRICGSSCLVCAASKKNK